jgi:hypothetical protein
MIRFHQFLHSSLCHKIANGDGNDPLPLPRAPALQLEFQRRDVLYCRLFKAAISLIKFTLVLWSDWVLLAVPSLPYLETRIAK